MLRGEALDGQEAARLSLRRHRPLQGDRRRGLHAERAARSEARAYVDGLIAKIAAAQEPDGYLYTTRTIDPENPHRWAGTERWVLERDDSHELYNLGHLFEAAVAHYLATGKRTLLDVALQDRRPARPDVRPRQAVDLARPPDHRDGAGEAVPRDRRRALPRPREVPARRARARTAREGRGPRLQPGAREGDRADRAGRPRGARDVHVLGHGRRRRAHRRRRPTSTPSTGSGTTSSREALPHRRHRRLRPGEAFGSRLRAAEHDAPTTRPALGRQRLLEPPPVPAPRRRASTST